MLGIPFVGEGQASAFHPLSFLYVLMKPGLAMNWIIAGAFVLTGGFFYGYLRALGLGRAAAWYGAATWSFSSAMVSRIMAGHLNILLTFISIPMILMFWERYRADGAAKRLVGVAFGYGLMILAFYPQLLYIFSLFFLGYVLIQSASDIRAGLSSVGRESRAILLLGFFLVLGFGIGAIQLLPSLDFVSRSFRQETSAAFAGTFSFAPENLLTLIAPRFFGTTVDQALDTRYWGRNFFWEMWLYIGILPLILAAVGAWSAPRRLRWPLLICGAAFLLIALGKHTLLFPLLYEHLPLFGIFRGPSKNSLVTLVCLVVLSAYGFQALFAEADERRRLQCRRIAVIAGALLFVSAAVVAVALLRDVERPGSNWARLIEWIWSSGERRVASATEDTAAIVRATADGAAAALGRAIVLIALSLTVIFAACHIRWRRHACALAIGLTLCDLMGTFLPMLVSFDRSTLTAPLELTESRRTPYPPRILVPSNRRPNLAMRSGYSSPFGYAGNTLARYNTFISRIQGLDPGTLRAESRFERFTPQFRVMGLDAIAVDPPEVPEGASVIGRLGERVLIPFDPSNERTMRAYLAAAPRYVTDRNDALQYVMSPDVDGITSPVIERASGHLPAHPLEAEEFVRVVSYEPNRIELQVHTNWRRELIFRGMFERNWKAMVDDVPALVEPANYVFRAVQVPAGASRVVFHYSPRPFYLGATFTGLSLAVLIVVAAAARLTPSRDRSRGKRSGAADNGGRIR